MLVVYRLSPPMALTAVKKHTDMSKKSKDKLRDPAL